MASFDVECADLNGMHPRGHPFQRIAQGASVAFKRNLHDVSGFQPYALSEAKCVGAEEVYVDVAWPAVTIELEVMVLQVRDGMRHGLFARSNCTVPQRPSPAFHADGAGHGGEFRSDDQFGTDGSKPGA